MSDLHAHQPAPRPSALAEIIATAAPMGDLGRFVIDDLSAEDEDAFFSILENV
jgi:hypothetical protein